MKLPQFPDKLKSRKLWLSLLSAVLPILNDHFEWGLDVPTMIAFVGSLLTWVIVEGGVDMSRAEKK